MKYILEIVGAVRELSPDEVEDIKDDADYILCDSLAYDEITLTKVEED